MSKKGLRRSTNHRSHCIRCPNKKRFPSHPTPFSQQNYRSNGYRPFALVFISLLYCCNILQRLKTRATNTCTCVVCTGSLEGYQLGNHLDCSGCNVGNPDIIKRDPWATSLTRVTMTLPLFSCCDF